VSPEIDSHDAQRAMGNGQWAMASCARRVAARGRFRYHFPESHPANGELMKYLAVLLVTAGVFAAQAVQADAGEDLLKKYGCTACHAIDKKVVGPAYTDVAAKYKGDAGAPAKLAAKVKAGGSGVWGAIPMPPNPTVSDADLKALITYILALKK
jgi:cytochrome c